LGLNCQAFVPKNNIQQDTDDNGTGIVNTGSGDISIIDGIQMKPIDINLIVQNLVKTFETRDKQFMLLLQQNISNQLSSQKTLIQDFDVNKSITEAVTKAVTALVQETYIDKTLRQKALHNLQKGDKEEAKHLFSKILSDKKLEGYRAYKEASTAAIHLGSLYSLDNPKEALRYYNEAIEYDPNNLEGWLNLGNFLYRINKLDDALITYKKLLELGEINENYKYTALAYQKLGFMYGEKGDLEQADKLLNRSLNIIESIKNKTLEDKKILVALHNGIGNLYFYIGDSKNTEELFFNMTPDTMNYKAPENTMCMATENYSALGKISTIRTSFELEKAEQAYLNSVKIINSLDNKTPDDIKDLIFIYNKLGNIYFERKDLQLAEEFYQKGLYIIEIEGNKIHENFMISLYHNLGLIYKIRENLLQTKKYYLKALEIAKTLKNHAAMAISYGYLNVFYQEFGESEQAIETFLKLEENIKYLNNQDEVIIVYYTLGELYETHHIYEYANKIHFKELKFLKNLENNEYSMANVYSRLGHVYEINDDLEHAEEMYLNSLKIRKDLKDKEEIMKIYIYLGDIYEQQNKFKKAEEVYLRALELSELKYKKIRRILYIFLGKIYGKLGNSGLATKMFNESLKIKQVSYGNGVTTDAYMGLNLYGNITDNTREELLQDLEKNLKLKKKLDDKEGIADYYTALGKFHYDSGEFKQAEKMYLEALKINNSLDNSLNFDIKKKIAIIYNHLGSLYQDMNDFVHAEEMYHKNLEVYSELKHVDEECKECMLANYELLGTLYEQFDNPKFAIEMYLKSLEIHNSLKYKEFDKNHIHSSLTKLYFKQGNILLSAKMYFKSLSGFTKIFYLIVMIIILFILSYIVYMISKKNSYLFVES